MNSEVLQNDWKDITGNEFNENYFKTLNKVIEEEYKTKTIFPDKNDIFNALKLTPFDQVKVVIIGQDPYHNDGQANGLCFSVKQNVTIPPSLRNIYKELNSDLGCIIPTHGCLEKWARQGVLLLNAILTVKAHEPASHRKIGWEIFTDNIIKKLNERETPVVFILWGNFAKSKKALITNQHHFIIEAVHPSPLSANRGFFGSKPFSKTNSFLERQGIRKIDWQID